MATPSDTIITSESGPVKSIRSDDQSTQADASENKLDPVRWLEQHGDFLFNFAYAQVRSQHIAEDLVQETLLGALASQDRYEGRATERTWLVSILRNKLADHIRKRSRERKHHEDSTSEEAIKAMFSDKGFWKVDVSTKHQLPKSPSDKAEFWQIFVECSHKISPVLADAFCLREMNQFETSEICEILNISETNLSTMLYRARMLLRKCMELNWFAPDEIPGKGGC